MPGTFGTPILIVSPSGTALQGSSIKLNCTATLQLLNGTGQCEPENCGRILWNLGLGDVHVNGSTSERFFKEPLLIITSQLNLNPISTANAGFYTCKVSIPDGFPGAAVALAVSG